MDEELNNTWSRHTMKYYTDLQRKEIPARATAWTNPEDTMLSEMSQSQKDKCCRIRFH